MQKKNESFFYVTQYVFTNERIGNGFCVKHVLVVFCCRKGSVDCPGLGCRKGSVDCLGLGCRKGSVDCPGLGQCACVSQVLAFVLALSSPAGFTVSARWCLQLVMQRDEASHLG